MSSQSKAVTPSVGAASSLSWNEYYSTLLINNVSGATIYVRTDGTAANNTGTTAGQEAILNGQSLVVASSLGLPQPNLNAAQTATNFAGGPPGGGSFGGFNESSIAAPSFTTRDQSESWAWTTQPSYAGTNYTEISIAADSAGAVGGVVVVTPQ